MGKELDILIQTGVTQLVMLLANTEKGSAAVPNQSGISSRKSDLKKAIKLFRRSFNKSIKCQSLMLEFYFLSESRKDDADEVRNESKGPITERLLSEGLLTPHMLEELKKEWQIREEQSSSVVTSEKNSKIKKVVSKKKRKPRL